MKQSLFRTQLASLLLLLLLPNISVAHDFEVNGIYYNIDGDNAVVTYKGTSYYHYSDEYSGEVTIPSSVTHDGTTYNVNSIGQYAFNNCSGLTNVIIPNSVTSIGYSAFYGCSGLIDITIPNTITSFRDYCFYGCIGLTSITIPNSVSFIGNYCFYGCSGLTNIVIPNTVTSLGVSAFQGCSCMKSIAISNSVTSIGDYCFMGCSSLMSIVIPDVVTSLGVSAFADCSSMKSIAISNSVTSIGDYCFMGCSSLMSIVIPDVVTSLGVSAFADCSSMKSIAISNSVTSIGDYCFMGCSSLMSIVIPDVVTSIGDYCFMGCSSLPSIVIPNSVTSIGVNCFKDCFGLSSIIVSNGNIKYDSRNNCNAIIETSNNELIVGCKNTIIPNTVTTIGDNAFYNCTGLINIKIPDYVNTIGNSAFRGCTNLLNVTLGASVESIYQSFWGCSSLMSITCWAITPPYADYYSFYGVPDSMIVYVPVEAIEDYQADYTWRIFTILPLKGNVSNLTICLPDGTDVSKYKDMKLEIANKNDDQKLHYIITDKQSYTFSRLDFNTSWKVTLANQFGDCIGLIENVSIDSSDVTLTFPELKKPQTVSLTVKTPDGQDVTNETRVSWFDENGDFLIQGNRIAGLPSGKKLTYSVTLPQEFVTAYSLPTNIDYTVKDGTNNLDCQLTEIAKVNLFGKVKDAKTNQPLYGATISATQSFSGGTTKTITVTTDNQGQYSFDASTVPTTLTIAASGYINQTIDCDMTSGGSIVTVPDVALSPITGAVVNINLTYTPAHAEGEVVETQNWYSDYSNVDYEVYNKTTNRAISDIHVQYPQIVLMEDVNNGDLLELTATSRKNAFKPVKTTVTIAEQKATATFNITELGKVTATFNRNINPKVTGTLYDAENKLVKTAGYSDSTLTIGELPDGNYTLVTMGKSDFFNSIYDLDQFAAAGLTEGDDFVKNVVQVNSGIISQVSIDEVPFFDESKFYYTGEHTSFIVNKPDIVVGNYLTFRAQLDFKEQYINQVSDVQLIVDIPESCSFIDNSVMMGSSLTGYSTSGNRIIVPLANWNDMVVRFCAIPTEIGNFAPSAFVRFKLNGKTITQPIGNAIYSADGLTLNTVSHTSDSIIHVHGTVNHGHTVKIYDGNVLVGQTQCRSDGYWFASVNLYKPYTHSYHRIHAEIETDQGFAFLTESKMVEYDKNMPQLLSITMCGRYGNIVFDQVNGTTNPPYYYNYKEGEGDFTFIAKFDRNDSTLIKDLEFKILCEDRKIHSINGIFDSEENGWIARANFDSYGLPINVTVDYIYSGVSTIYDADMHEDFTAIFNEVLNEIESAYGNFELEIINENSNELSFSIIPDGYHHKEFYTISLLDYDNTISHYEDGAFFVINNVDLNIGFVLDEIDDKPLMIIWDYNAKSALQIINDDNCPIGEDGLSFNFLPYVNTAITAYNIIKGLGEFYFNLQEINDWEITLKEDGDRQLKFYHMLLDLIYAKCADGSDKIQGFFDKYYLFNEASDWYTETIHKLNNLQSAIEQDREALWRNIMVKGMVELGMNVIGRYVSAVFAKQEWCKSLLDKLGNLTKGISGEQQLDAIVGLYGNSISELLDLDEAIDANRPFKDVISQVREVILRETMDNFVNLSHKIKSLYKCMDDDEEVVRDEDEDNNNDFFCPPVIPIHDPSGFVYEGVPSNRLQGVTTTCYYKETIEDMYGNLIENVVLWDAENYGQENPLITDENGYYRWDVPIGMWQVKYEKEGYETTYSDWLPVPPPQLDVNIGMVQMRQPEVIKARAYPKAVEFEFDKFMFPESLTTRNIKVTNEWGEDVSGTIELLNAEVDDPLAITSIRRAPETGLTFASKVRFNAYYPFYGNEVTLHVSKRVKSYADLEMSEDYVVTLPIENEMEKIVVDTTLTLLYGDSHTMTVTVEPPIASNGKKLIVRTASPRIISTDAESYTLDNNGQAVVTVHGDLLGMTSLLFSVEGYDLSATTLVDVLLESQITVATPTASIASGSEVEKGTAVYLYCMTEGATIYYTLDGSCPCDNTPARKVYDGSPIIINDFMTIKAMAVADGLYDSDVATFVYRLMRLKGDVNLDGEVDIADINAVIDVILKNNADQGTRGRADVNNDGEVNIADINDIIDIILNTSHFTQHNVNCDDKIHLDNVTLKPGDVRTLQVTIDNATHYSAMQCDIILPEGLTLLNTAAASENVCKVGHLDEMSSRALTYSTNKAPFMNDGQGVLTLTVRADAALPSESEITLTNVVLADQENKAWHIADCTAQVNNSSGINDLTAIADRVWVEGHTLFIETRQEGTAQLATINGIVYNITLKHGINQLQLEQGVYIVVINGNSHKIAIK